MILRQTGVGLFLLFITMSIHLSCSAGSIDEISGLLNFVERSGCIFIRNGKQYDSFEARQHIEKKYNYYKRRIVTAEDFILYSATQSSISGKPYKVLCDGVRMNSSDWLKAELDNVRMR